MRKLSLFWMAIAIPLSSPKDWQDLKFSQIKPNTVEFSDAGLKVTVKNSASPLIYPLPKPVLVESFRAVLEIEGELKNSADWPEDAYLRMGFVVPGTRKLGRLDRVFAPAWIKQLFALAPPGVGIDRIQFFNLVEGGEKIGQSRTLPKSKDLIVENVVAQRSGRDVRFEHKLNPPLEVAALWLSIDGDNSQSSFITRIRSLELNPAETKK